MPNCEIKVKSFAISKEVRSNSSLYFCLKVVMVALSSYVTQTLEGLKTGDFLYLAHPDIAGYLFSDDAVEREYLRLCEGAKALRIPLEINLLGLRSKRQYPNERLFKIAAKVGNEVSIGCDAHEPQHAGDLVSEKTALEMVQKLGLRLIDKPLI